MFCWCKPNQGCLQHYTTSQFRAWAQGIAQDTALKPPPKREQRNFPLRRTPLQAKASLQVHSIRKLFCQALLAASLLSFGSFEPHGPLKQLKLVISNKGSRRVPSTRSQTRSHIRSQISSQNALTLIVIYRNEPGFLDPQARKMAHSSSLSRQDHQLTCSTALLNR